MMYMAWPWNGIVTNVQPPVDWKLEKAGMFLVQNMDGPKSLRGLSLPGIETKFT